MVDGRSMEHLIVEPGSRVSAFGHIERDADARPVLWVAFPWEPRRWPYRTTGGDIAVERVDLPEETIPPGLVRVEGTWTGNTITEAVVEPVNAAEVASWSSGEGEVTPAELGAEKFAQISSMLDHAGPAPSLGSGGTDAAMWRHVLYVTPELVKAHRGLPIRVDTFTAMSPA